MRRREFISLLGATAVGSPLAARAQPIERLRKVGVLMSAIEGDQNVREQLAEFRKRLLELGWTDERNVRFDVRWAGGDASRLRANAGELVSLNPDVIVVTGASSVTAVQQHSRSIPVVFTQLLDPLGAGFVVSLARPGGSVTGFTLGEFSMGGKWLEILAELAPGLNRVGVIHAELATQVGAVQAIEALAPQLGIQMSPAVVRGRGDIEQVVAAIARQPGGGLIVMPNQHTITHRKLVIALAARHRLPAVYGLTSFVRDGGLASYGVDLRDLSRRAATYVDRILKGEKPGDLPVQQPTKFELVINLKTAKALGLAVPPTMLTRADEVIE